MSRVTAVLLSVILFSTLSFTQSVAKKAPVLLLEPSSNTVKKEKVYRELNFAENYVLVDSMYNAYGAALSLLNPLAYDPWSNTAAVIHRGAPPYTASSGQLWYNISTDKGLTWSLVNFPINSYPLIARYPSMAISNPAKGNISSTTGFFSWPEITPSTFGYLGYGADQPLGAGSPFSISYQGDVMFSSQAPTWANDSIFYMFWAADQQISNSITLFRTDFITLDIIDPPQWQSFQDGGCLLLGGFSRNGVQYFAVLGTLEDPDTSNPIITGWYPAYSKSTDNGITWSEWNIADFRTIPGLTKYDRLWDWEKGDPYVRYQGDIIVDNEGYVHLIFGVTDTTTDGNSGNNAIIEVYESAEGWKGKVIAEYGPESDLTDWTYGSLNQCGYSAYLSVSDDGKILAAQWAMGTGPDNLVDLFYSYRQINGEWFSPVNLTNTPGINESISHMSPQMKSGPDDNYTFFSMYVYDGSGAVPPDDISITNIYIAPVTFEVTIQPAVTVIQPNGGENIAAGTEYNIKWFSTKVSDVKIEFTTNSGASWITITGSTPSSGSYNWDVPNLFSDNCRIKISDVSNPDLYDISDNDFTVTEAMISVISPNGGENWQTGSTQNILWESTIAGNIKIEFSTNNGNTWSIAADNIPNDGIYEWSIPNTPSNSCKVRISDVSNPSVNGTSEDIFYINPFAYYAKIGTIPVWIDSDYDGLVVKNVTGNGSFIGTGTITGYQWYVNNTLISNEMNPDIELVTGTNILKLVVTSNTGQPAVDTKYVSVYSSKLSMGSAILSGISQLGKNFYVTSTNNGVYRIDSTGTILQSYLTGGSIESALTISRKTSLMYVGSGERRLYCFDAGLNSLWDTGLGGLVDNSVSLNYNGDIVYIGVNDNTYNLGSLRSVTAGNGNPRWNLQVEGRILSSPAVLELTDSLNNVVKTIIYFGTNKGVFYAVEDLGTSGSIFWSYETSPDSAIISSPAVSSDGMIYISSMNGYLYRFTWDGYYQTGWKKFIGGPVISSPVIDENGIVYIASSNGHIAGYGKEFIYNSEPLKTFYQKTKINGTPAIGPDGTLLIGLNNGKFFALEKNAPGREMKAKWYFEAPGPIYAPALITENGIVYIGTLTGDVFVLSDPGTGSHSIKAEWPTFRGDNQRSKVVRILQGIVSVSEENVITEYFLYQNYPNPFNPATKIKYQIP
jgi:hypothetical protein